MSILQNLKCNKIKLKVSCIQETNFYDIPFSFIHTLEYKDRETFLMYFFIEDMVNNIVYIYTQYDIENNFYNKGIDIKGLTRNGTHLKLVSKSIKRVNHYQCNTTGCKIVYGKDVDVLPIYYKSLYIWSTTRWYFNSLFDVYGIDYYKFLDKTNYDFDDNINYLKKREIRLVNIDSTFTYSKVIKEINEYSLNNYLYKLPDIFSGFSDELLDLRDLKVQGIFDFCSLCRNCHNLKEVYLCEIELNKPLLLKEMFSFCQQLQYIDMTNLKGDYPDNYFGISKDILKENMNMGFYFADNTFALLNKLLVVLPKTAKNFIKLLQESNNMHYLGKVRKEYREEDIKKYQAKQALLGQNYNINFVIEV